ncbi:MAG: glycosyltransferase family 2 protein [Bacteroidetes bacterium]|nr:glycosyltransferase family 2 protein [Bacteroidota bacterium]
MAPKVAIAILNWNGRNYLQQFLPFVLASTYSNKEVIVIDNASTDDSVVFLQQYFPQVRIIQLPSNKGYAGGYNVALKQVQSDYYVLLNSDVEVEPGWIEPIIELMEKDKTIGACQPKLLMYKQRDTFEYAGAAGGWIDYLGYPFARGRIFDVCEKDEHQYDSAEPVFWASGAAMFVRAKLFHELHGLDNYFFAHQEEIDFCWRLQLAGYSVYACPQSVVYHVGGGTLPKGNERKVFLNFRNNLIMLAKNTSFGEALWKIPFRILLDALSAWKSLFSGQFIYFTAVIEAHLAFVKWILFKRKESVFPVSRNGKLQGCFSKSIIWNHFVQGKKTFEEIVRNKR